MVDKGNWVFSKAGTKIDSTDEYKVSLLGMMLPPMPDKEHRVFLKAATKIY